VIDRLFCAAMALPLAVYGLVGAFSRYTADDFCWAGVLRTEGFVQANVHWYAIYSPRYAFTFLVNLTELVGPAVVPFLPASAILVWLVALTFTFAQFRLNLLPACVLAEVFALGTLQTAPDLPQSLYWQTGLLTYLLPLILASFLVGWIRQGTQSWWALLVSGLVTFVAGGLSETYLIPQNVAVTLALLAALRFKSRRGHLLAAFAGGVLALLVIVIAPATASRVNGTPADLWLALSASVATGWFQALRLVRFFPLTLLLGLAVSALVGRGHIPRQWLIIVTAAVLITLPFCYFPSFYAQNGNPPMRSLIVPGAILIGYCMFLGFALGPRLAVAGWMTPGRRSVALMGLALVPIGIAVVTVPEIVSAAQYAAIFDAEDQQIRASANAGASDLTVPVLPQNFGENFVSADRQDWFNQCVARYYGLQSIAAAPT